MSARFQYASDQSLLVYFGEQSESDRSKGRPLQKKGQDQASDPVGNSSPQPLQNRITLQANENVRKLLRLMEQEPVAHVRNLHPAYCSLLIKFDALRLGMSKLQRFCAGYLARLDEVKTTRGAAGGNSRLLWRKVWPGFRRSLQNRGMTEARAIELHSSIEYLVYFLGFVPGFAYLGELAGRACDATAGFTTKKSAGGAASESPAIRRVCIRLPTPEDGVCWDARPAKMFRADREAFSPLVHRRSRAI